MGNHTEFRRGVELLQSELDFDQDRNVSVFETNIRVVGGLLSSHLMAKEMCDQHGCVGSQRGTAVSSALPVPPLPPLTPFPTLGNRGTKTSCSTWPWTSRSASCQRLTPPRVRLPTTAPPPPPAPLALTSCHGRPTSAGIPYGTVNLRYGVPPGETVISSLAGGGTHLLEFSLLSRLTGRRDFELAARGALRALWARRSPYQLLGNHINIQTGRGRAAG